MDKKEEIITVVFALILLFAFIVAMVFFIGFGTVIVGIISIVCGLLAIALYGLLFMRIKNCLKKDK